MKKNFTIPALFFLSFFGGILIPHLNGEALQSSILEYGQGHTLEDDLVRFHLQMNDITNEFLEGLIEVDQPNVEYPTSKEECSEDNVSTFCLATVLNEELTAFEKGLDYHRERFQDDPALRDEPKPGQTLSDAISAQKQRVSLIESDLETARKALDLTLAVYNEVQMTYPVHKELVRLVDNLEEYRNHLADIRDTIELFPSRFNDATTTQCK